MENLQGSLLINPSEALANEWPKGTVLLPIFHYGVRGSHWKKGNKPNLVAFSLIDSSDLQRVITYQWFLCQPKPHIQYAQRCERQQGKTVSILLHRFLLGLPPGRTPQVDHRNRIGLDNRRKNLREATHAENLQNQRKRPNLSSRYRGVHFSTNYNNWAGYAYINGKLLSKRHFKTEEEAAAYARDLRLKHMPFTEEDLR